MAAPKKNMVVLGASYGGVSITHYLLKQVVPSLATPSDYQIVLVSPSAQILSRPAVPRGMVSEQLLDQSRLFVDIEPLFKQYPGGSVRFLRGTATHVAHEGEVPAVTVQPAVADPAGTVLQPEIIPYHALVIATGARTHSPLLGLTSDTEELRASWTVLREALPNAKSIVIAGGGPAGIETAGELGEHLNGKAGLFKKRLENPKVEITVVTASDYILPALRPPIAAQAEALLGKLGVTVLKNATVTSVEPPLAGSPGNVAPGKTVIRLEDGKTLEADIYIPATGWTYNTAFVPEALLATDGRVETNPKTLRVDAAGPRVYTLGDVSTAHRAAVHHILASVPVLGNNIKRDLLLAEGKAADDATVPKDKEFAEDKRETQLVPIGRSAGVGAAMGFKFPALVVKLIKSRDYFLWTTPRLWSGKQWAKP